MSLRPQVVSDALAACLAALQVIQPPFSTYKSRSLRSGSVTAQVLLNIPNPIIRTRGGWRNSDMVMNVYFDSRLHLTTEMKLYFWSLKGKIPLSLPSPQ